LFERIDTVAFDDSGGEKKLCGAERHRLNRAADGSKPGTVTQDWVMPPTSLGWMARPVTAWLLPSAFTAPIADSGRATHLPWRESLAKPEKPSGPTFLRNPPKFSDPFTFRRPHSDAVIRRVCHFSTTAYSVPNCRGRSQEL
jgi:hypothetical protein